jgi:phage gp29-like protein
MQYGISRRILGETLTAFGNEGGTGSKAQGNTHADTLDQRSVELCLGVEFLLNQDLIRRMVLWNFGPAAPMPKFSYDLEQQEDLGKRLIVDSGLQKMGKSFSVGYIVDKYEVPICEGEDPDQVLKPTAATPPVAAPEPGADDDPADGEDFSESSHGERAVRELKEFDDVFGSLREMATGIYKDRVQELVDSAIPVDRS